MSINELFKNVISIAERMDRLKIHSCRWYMIWIGSIMKTGKKQLLLEVIIETPRGSSEKYSYDFEKKWCKVKKFLPAGMVLPFDFGCIPGTMGEDGDPLDIIVLSSFHTYPGSVMDVRIIGAIQAKQTGQKGMIRNDRYIGIPEDCLLLSNMRDIKDVPRKVLTELEDFFKNYNSIEGKKFKVIATIGGKQAYSLIQANKTGIK